MLFGKNKTVHYIELDSNSFQFDLSKVVFLDNLTNLLLDHNEIYGSLPEELTTLKFDELDVSYNNFAGKFLKAAGFRASNLWLMPTINACVMLLSLPSPSGLCSYHPEKMLKIFGKSVPFRVSGTIYTMATVKEDENSTTSSSRRRSPADNTTLAEFQRRQERKKAGKGHEKGPEKEPKKEHLVLGSSQPNPKKPGNTNLTTKMDNLHPPRNTTAPKKRSEDQKLAKIETKLKKLRDENDQNQRMKRYVLEETRRRCLLGQPDPTDQELPDLIDKKKARHTLALLEKKQVKQKVQE
ncbi:OLC1v1037050C1 [Oldenlandia corymbosa var. corymbosa]|uniref:OLC1v1037050C1 n=1 Tax=Oldenlandia corymbosa var. corymbosa TaxID=529605 RepID=A0AAV1CWV2_OLDCO|nr:OLC1v1037050C1 [Oldenlandia corymbosa var. corymbosa]